MTNSTQLEDTSRTQLEDSKPQRDYILLDGSGSMSSRWWESLAAIDAYVAGLKTARVASSLTLAAFTNDGPFIYDEARLDVTPETWVDVSKSPPTFYGGGTPLYDAINVMMGRLAKLDPARCAILIVTDGQATESTTTLDQAKALLDWARMKGWQITFMGCDWDSTGQAKSLGATEHNSIGTSAARLVDAASELAKKRANHAVHGAPMHWSPTERSHFGGYLPGSLRSPQDGAKGAPERGNE